MLSENLQREAQLLQHSWDRHSPEHLDEYLVAATEDPRINIPSILTRALFADTLFPDQFAALSDEELRFGLCLTWLTDALESAPRIELSAAAPEFPDAPPFMAETARLLQDPAFPLIDYLTEALALEPDIGSEDAFASSVLDTFANVWQSELSAQENATTPMPRVIELACGSGNDYRFLHDFGFARFLDYTGIDIAGKNIANAKRRFPQIDFRTANAYATGLPDASADIIFAHDLYEHLSLEALEAALAETARLLRPGGQAWLHFFNLADTPEHEARPHESYHWNLLSKNSILDTLTSHGLACDALPMRDLVHEKFGFSGYYNQEAVLISAEKIS